jgi:NlpC/P60 family putative phage cell wall peptidase
VTSADCARGWIGTPYHHQAAVKAVGCDCLGLVRGVFAELFGALPDAPPYSPDWAEAGQEERLIEGLSRWLVRVPDDAFLIGDVLVFRLRPGVPAKHVAIVASDASMIHAHQRASVAEVPLSRWWLRHRAATFRFPDHSCEA